MLAAALGQQVLVENRPGSGNIIGATFTNRGKRYTAFAFERNGKIEYFDETGRPLKKVLIFIAAKDDAITLSVENPGPYGGPRAGSDGLPTLERQLHRLARVVELAQDRHDAAGAVHVLHVVLRRARRDLAQLRHAPREAVDVGHREVEQGADLVRGGRNALKHPGVAVRHAGRWLIQDGRTHFAAAPPSSCHDTHSVALMASSVMTRKGVATMASFMTCSWNSGTPSVRFRTGSSEGCGYSTGARPFRRSM